MLHVTDKTLRSAYASKLAYAESKQKLVHNKTGRQLHGKPYDYRSSYIIDVEKTGSHAYVWKSGTHSYIVAFRGSHNIKDVGNYLNFAQKDFAFLDHQVKIHGGVLAMFESIEPELTSVLTDMTTSKLPKYITFCGHSLGGAIASFASTYYAALSNNTIHVSCHTFGAPFIGDDAFYRWSKDVVNETIYYKTKTDPIPNVQLCSVPPDPHAHTISINDQWLDPFTAHDMDTYIHILESKTRLPPKISKTLTT